jgi:hypothetical protein
MNKDQIKDLFGQQFNDYNSDFWTYRTSNLSIKSTANKYMYLLFKNNKLIEVRFSKVNRIVYLYHRFLQIIGIL